MNFSLEPQSLEDWKRDAKRDQVVDVDWERLLRELRDAPIQNTPQTIVVSRQLDEQAALMLKRAPFARLLSEKMQESIDIETRRLQEFDGRLTYGCADPGCADPGTVVPLGPGRISRLRSHGRRG